MFENPGGHAPPCPLLPTPMATGYLKVNAEERRNSTEIQKLGHSPKSPIGQQ